MRTGTILLVLFIGLTVVFATISALEFRPVPIQSNYTTTTTTTITTTYTVTTTTQSGSQTSNSFPDKGYILIAGVGYFSYMRVPTSAGEPSVNTETLQNVTFTYLKPNATTTGGICHTFKANFQDGSSENLTACSYPTNFETDVVFSKHVKPTAGLMFVPYSGSSIYVLVST